MKRALLFIAAFGAVALAHAGPFEWSARQDPVVIHYNTGPMTVSTTAVLIDLSDITNYGHRLTGQVNISDLRVELSKAAASTGTLRIGVVYNINPSTGDVHWFYALDFSRDTAGLRLNDHEEFAETSIRAKAKVNSTPYLAGNVKSQGSTTFQSDVMLNSIVGTTSSGLFPDIGDIVFDITTAGSNAYTLDITAIYTTEK